MVAVNVVAIPVMGVSGSPALIVSTVGPCHGSRSWPPVWSWMRSMIWRAVSPGEVGGPGAAPSSNPTRAVTTNARTAIEPFPPSIDA